MTDEQHRPALANNALALLVESGILAKDDMAQRVVIDISANNVVRVWTQKVADERLLTVLDPITRLGVEEHHAPTD